jgi:O-acetyl-ADP-ribose deacetylase (regulator of RNase III)
MFQTMIDIIQADITTLAVDAIVNAANRGLRGGGGVDGAIHRAAGPELLRELLRYPGCEEGDAVRTRGYLLRSKYVIHAVGPVWRGGHAGEPAQLRRAYESAFARAHAARDVRSIAFPAISTGVYGYPKRDAARIALDVMRAHESEYDLIVACLFDDESVAVYRDLLDAPRAARDD